jgi:hypothetical protein
MSDARTNWPGILDAHELDLVLAGDDIDELRELHDTLSDQLGKVDRRIFDLENGTDEWTAYRDCVTGERRIW